MWCCESQPGGVPDALKLLSSNKEMEPLLNEAALVQLAAPEGGSIASLWVSSRRNCQLGLQTLSTYKDTSRLCVQVPLLGLENPTNNGVKWRCEPACLISFASSLTILPENHKEIVLFETRDLMQGDCRTKHKG